MNSPLLYRGAFMCFLILTAPISTAADNTTGSGPALESLPDDSVQRGLKKKRPQPAGKPEPALEMAPGVSPPGPQVLPPVPAAGDQHRLSVLPTIMVKKIVVQGNTVIPAPQLAQLLKAYENKTQTFEELNRLRYQLSQYYLEKGYVNSGVIIPDQKIEDGQVTFQAIEGDLTSIEIDGLQSLSADYVRGRLRAMVRAPLNVNDLSGALKMLNQDPLIKQINARLLPGEKLGQSHLKVALKEADPVYYSLGIDNYLSPSAGAERLVINAGHGNLFGRGDALDAELEITEGLNGLGLVYSLPISATGSAVNVFADYRNYAVVEEPFDAIDIESESTTMGFSVDHPFIQQLNETLGGSLGLEVKHSENTLAGVPFSFSMGEINGESDVTVVDATVGWVKRFPGRVYSLQGSFRLGVNALGATENNGDLPDGRFSLFKGRLQVVQLLQLWQSQFIVHGGFQLANDPLLSIEKYAVGGRYTVRGYRENQFVRDNGINMSLEWRIPLQIQDGSNQWHIAPFVDYGSSWDKNEDLTSTEKASIASAGLGLLYDPAVTWHLEVFWGTALDDVPEPADHNLQDDGIHFQVIYHPTKS
jgi:hemolysin activation/secretion protein